MISEQLLAADREAADDALEAGPEAIMAGAADREAGPAVLADLLAHELAAGHRLMLRLAAAADAVLDWGADEPAAAERSAAELAAGRLAAVASRLMEQLRQGLATLRRFRPESAEDGAWIALSWLDGRCSQEELERRVAAAKAAKAANDPETASPALGQRAQLARSLAAEEAVALAAARAGAQADAAADERTGTGFLARLFAHELGTSHALMMRLTGSAHAALDRATAAAAEPKAALGLAAIAARLGERFRRGLLTLAAGPDGKPRRVTGLIWGGPEADAANAPTAGHGVHRPDFAPAAG